MFCPDTALYEGAAFFPRHAWLLIADITDPNSLVQLDDWFCSLRSAITLPRTRLTIRFIFSTDPWSRGTRGLPVTDKMLGLLF